MNEIELPREQREAFNRAVWKITAMVPEGKVATYGQIGAYIPLPKGVREEDYRAYRARWVGAAMAACPEGLPWQRVINSQGKISPRQGADMQRALLEAEGVRLRRARQDRPGPFRLVGSGRGLVGGERFPPAPVRFTAFLRLKHYDSLPGRSSSECRVKEYGHSPWDAGIPSSTTFPWEARGCLPSNSEAKPIEFLPAPALHPHNIE